MASREVYCIVNRPIETEPGRRQFVQVRGMLDPAMAGTVHDMTLLSGAWFSDAGVRTPVGARPGDRDQIEAVVGAGIARELGKLQGKDSLTLGDTFGLGDREWVVVGIMKSDGTSFGSEVWAKHDRVSKMFNKSGYSSLLVRRGGRRQSGSHGRAGPPVCRPPARAVQQPQGERDDRRRSITQNCPKTTRFSCMGPSSSPSSWPSAASSAS